MTGYFFGALSLTQNLSGQVRVLPGHSDDEKPHSAHDGVAPKT